MAQKTVLDLGCGCGGIAIASKKAGAARVICNDVDVAALAASGLNGDANGVEVELSGVNLLETDVAMDGIEVVFVGDLLYDEDVARCLVKKAVGWKKKGMEVYVGDPGRIYCTKVMSSEWKNVAKYSLPPAVILENYTFKEGYVWKASLTLAFLAF